jgi:heptosyltransferase-1
LRALVVRLSAIGDVVHTLPVLPPLRRAGWEVAWLVEPAAAPLVTGHPMLARTVLAPSARRFDLGAARASAATLRGLALDVALDLQGLWKSAAWARASRAARVIGFARAGRREPSSAILMGERAAAPSEVHVIDRNLALLRALGVEAVGEREFVFPETAAEQARVDAQLAALGARDVALLNPAGGWQSKLWPAERFGIVAQALRAQGLQPLVTWGPGEEMLADRVVAASAGTAQRCFSTTLLEYVALARRARVVIAADTGPLHLACAVGTPVVALFGPTDPARNGPFSPRDVVVRAIPPCAPCHRRDCPVHAGVMSQIEPASVIAAAARRLAA